MVRYLVSLVVFLAGLVLTNFLLNGDLLFAVLRLIYLPSFIIAGLLPFLFVTLLFGFKEMSQAFSICFKKEPERDKLVQALHFFNNYGKTTWFAGLIGVIIGVISMMANLEDKSMLGPSLALALLSLFYSGIINVLIIIPFTVFLNKHLKD
jgi:flagellar motor component MotA